ncbi:MAG TPA: hypothetical protein VF069_01660 [Streptosporangiaceae bacterium]
MSYGNSGDDRASRASWSQIILKPKQFEVIYQITHELSNCPDERLDQEGMSPEGVAVLIECIDSLRSLVERSSMVRIRVIDEPNVDFQEFSALNPVSEYSRNEWEAVGELPQDIAAIWQQLLRFVVSWLGQRELFLRTGYSLNEVNAAIDELVVRRAPT